VHRRKGESGGKTSILHPLVVLKTASAHRLEAICTLQKGRSENVSTTKYAHKGSLAAGNRKRHGREAFHFALSRNFAAQRAERLAARCF